MTTPKGWRGLPAWARWVGGIVTAVVVLNVAVTILSDLYGTPGGKPSSSYASAPEGTAAFAELLAAHGHPVVPLRGALTGPLPDDGVLVVLDPETMLAEETRAVRAWVERGGTLVIGGRPALWAEGFMDGALRWSPAGVLDAQPLVDVPETASVDSVGGEGFGTWEDSGSALPILGLESAPARTIVSIAELGEGRAVLLADTSILHNRFLAKAANATFALNIAGPEGTPVYFAEGVHGYGNETGLMAIPFRWKVVLIGLALAAIVWMVAVGRRLGPPEPEARDLPPPRRAYVEALATTLGRTKRADEVVEPVRAAVRSRIARRAGLEAESDDAALEGAGRALGLTDREIAAVMGRMSDPLAVGQALTKVGATSW